MSFGAGLASDQGISMQGKCFCGEIVFEISGEFPAIYQCHCSLCRRVSGSSANAATIVDSDKLIWLQGSDRISKYVSATGFQSHFCSCCGSPLPNPTRNGTAWWVPVGLLEQNEHIELAAHVFTQSKAHWETLPSAGQHFDQMPSAEALDRLLRRSKSV